MQPSNDGKRSSPVVLLLRKVREAKTAEKLILRSLGALLGLLGLAALWLGKQVLEEVLQGALRGAISQTKWGEGLAFLGGGLALAIAGPVVMARENRKRRAAEKKAKYHWVEFGVVVVGGIAFTACGIAMLLGWF